MDMSLMLAVHVLSIVIWVGGMFFSHQALRPAAVEILEPPARLRLWQATLNKFFMWVWLTMPLSILSGFWMFFKFPEPPLYQHIMMGLGVVMMLIFLHVFFAPYQRLSRAIPLEDWQGGGKALGQIRKLVGINVSIGLITIVIATLGKMFLT